MKSNVIKINDGITINANVTVKKFNVSEKDHVWNPATCNCENWKYLESIMDDSAIICDEVIDADAKLSPKNNDKTKTFLTNFNEKKPIFINHYSIIDSC